MKYTVLIGIALLFVIGCASQKPPYVDLINQPVPETSEELQKECLWLRTEIARQQAVADSARVMLEPSYILLIRAEAARNIAHLEHRAAMIGCPEFRH